MTDRPATDWEAIERAYRAGILSLREIGRSHGISEGAIRKRAKAETWQRDLTEKVREAVRTKLVRTEGTQPPRMHDLRTDAEIVEEQAEGVAGVIRLHRRDIAAGRDMASTIMAELLQTTRDREEIEADIEEETLSDTNGQRRARMMGAISLPSRASALKSLSDATRTFVALERAALGMDDGNGAGEAPAGKRPDLSGLTDEQLRALAAIPTR